MRGLFFDVDDLGMPAILQSSAVVGLFATRYSLGPRRKGLDFLILFGLATIPHARKINRKM